MFQLTKKNKLLLILSSVFITSAIVAELISSKLFFAHIHLFGLDFGTYLATIGILPWPIVFLATDTINEFYGPKVVRTLSIITCFMIGFAFLIVTIAMQPTAVTEIGGSKIPNVANDTQFNAIFNQSRWIILGSIVAFMVGQLLDSFVFWYFRKRTGGKLIWLRSTGSTLVSQLIDSFIVLYIGFVVPGTFTMSQFWSTGLTNYTFKLMIAVALTPLIYFVHWLVERYLGREEAHVQEEIVAEEAGNEKI